MRQDHLARHVIIYTDGFERVPDIGVDPIITKAQAANVRIHAVMLGRGSATFEKTLEKIAQPTGGQFVRYQSLDDLQPIWSQIVRDATQTVVTFPLPSANAREVQVSVNGVSAARALAMPALQLPIVTITTPPDGVAIERPAAASDTPLTDIEPRELPVQVQIAMADGLGTVADPHSICRVRHWWQHPVPDRHASGRSHGPHWDTGQRSAYATRAGGG